MATAQGIAFRLVRPAEHRVMPWKNGLGTTAEIAVDPPGSDVAGGFRWRLSIASVERSCAFSAFSGYERTIMVIEGKGMELRLPDLAPRRIDRLYEPFVFPGDRGADCTLIDGPIRDFNLMVDRASLRALTRIRSLAAGWHSLVLAGTTAIIHCLSGAAELALADDGPRAPLAVGDTAIIEVETPRELRLDISAAAACTLAAIALHPL
jgi:environmental stress-induced protein Ves